MVDESDEYLHLDRPIIPEALFGDSVWVSVMDRQANIFGVSHVFFSNHGYARWASLYQIDGVLQCWGNKHPLPIDALRGPWSDGRMSCEIVRPLDALRFRFDGPLYAYDLTFTGRHPAFEHDHSSASPALTADNEYFSMVWGGHYEQAMHCHGHFELRGGPHKGTLRRIDCLAHREHSWMHSFHEETQWERPQETRFPGHYWLILYLRDTQISALGPLEGSKLGMPTVGTCCGDNGAEPLRRVSGKVLLDADGETATGFEFDLGMPDGRSVRARTTTKHAQLKLWYRGDNCLDNPVDCFETFFDFELDTGERGHGVCEYSIHPAHRRWSM